MYRLVSHIFFRVDIGKRRRNLKVLEQFRQLWKRITNRQNKTKIGFSLFLVAHTSTQISIKHQTALHTSHSTIIQHSQSLNSGSNQEQNLP